MGSAAELEDRTAATGTGTLEMPLGLTAQCAGICLESSCGVAPLAGATITIPPAWVPAVAQAPACMVVAEETPDVGVVAAASNCFVATTGEAKVRAVATGALRGVAAALRAGDLTACVGDAEAMPAMVQSTVGEIAPCVVVEGLGGIVVEPGDDVSPPTRDAGGGGRTSAPAPNGGLGGEPTPVEAAAAPPPLEEACCFPAGRCEERSLDGQRPGCTTMGACSFLAMPSTQAPAVDATSACTLLIVAASDRT